jgi:hypothetical protein
MERSEQTDQRISVLCHLASPLNSANRQLEFGETNIYSIWVSDRDYYPPYMGKSGLHIWSKNNIRTTFKPTPFERNVNPYRKDIYSNDDNRARDVTQLMSTIGVSSA